MANAIVLVEHEGLFRQKPSSKVSKFSIFWAKIKKLVDDCLFESSISECNSDGHGNF